MDLVSPEPIYGLVIQEHARRPVPEAVVFQLVVPRLLPVELLPSVVCPELPLCF